MKKKVPEFMAPFPSFIISNHHLKFIEKKTSLPFSFEVIIGGAKGARTPDLYAASVALSQLSYGPILVKWGRDYFIKNALRKQ